MFHISEDGLAALERHLSLIFHDGIDWSRFRDRPDLVDAWEETAKALSQLRFPGPPENVEIFPHEPE